MPPKRIILKSSSTSSTETVAPSKKRASSRVQSKSASSRKGRASAQATRSSPRTTRSTKVSLESDLIISGAEDEQDFELSLATSSSSTLEELLSGKEGISEEEIDETDVQEEGDFSESETLSLAPSNEPTRLTARQRALLQAETLSLDSSPSLEMLSAPRALTEEELLKKSEKSRRRKTQRDQKLEQSKADTIQKLLQKQGSRSKKMKSTMPMKVHQEKAEAYLTVDPSSKLQNNCIRYLSKDKDTFIILGTDVPDITELQSQSSSPPTIEKCSIKGCNNLRKYSHAGTSASVCSLDCYKLTK